MKRTLAAFGVSLALLAGFVVALDPVRLLVHLERTTPWLFALGLVAVLAALVCWSLAMRELLAAAGDRVSVWRAFVAYGTSMFGKQVLPMGHVGGPALVAYTFDRETTLDYNGTLAVVTVAEFLNLAASLVLAVAGVCYLALFAPPTPVLRALGVGVGAVAAVVVGLVVAFRYRRGAVSLVVAGCAGLLRATLGRLSSRVAARVAPERVRAGLDRYYGRIDALATDRRALLAAFALTQVGWLCFAAPLYTGALALGVNVPLALVLFVVPASGLATIIPLPGGLGGIELVLAGVLVALAGVDVAAAAAVVVLYRLCSYWFLVLVGGVSTVFSATTVRELAAETAPKRG